MKAWVDRHRLATVILGFIVLVIVVSSIAGAVGSKGSDGSSSASSVSTPAPESSSPAGSSDTPNVPNDAVTQAAKWSKLESDCDESPSKLDAEVKFAYTDLQKHDEGETYVSLVRHLARSIPSDIAPTHCAQIIAAYLVIRED